ncbi:MAG: MBL fold metallo-hydrolase [Planctomycetes bacterium]|nr:MBL fold metallo-hydrolase [Planctomycetota bacterium]
MRLIVPGVWQLAGRPRDLINIYLAEDVLFDTGTRWSKQRVRSQLRGRRLRLVALTHCHPDHQGTAKWVCEHFGVPLACHEMDVPAMEGRAPMLPDNRLLRLGVRFWGGPPCRVDRVLREGDEVAGFRVVHAPGHTPGHVIYYRDADRVAIAGDVLANIHFLTRRPGLREPPPFFSADPDQNRRSIQILVNLKPSVVCFGHGPPLRDPELLGERGVLTP